MPQLAIAAVGAAVGAGIGGTVLGMSAAAVGWTLGSIAGALLFKPDSPGAQIADTRAAKLQYGARIPRPVGRVRLPLSPRWTSDWRATEQETGGKGGGGSEYFTYSADGLFWVADATQQIKLIALTRLWHNGKLVWSALADSDAESLANSEAAALFSEVEFHDGNASQMPWAVYEAAVGSVNADGHRRIACVSITNYQAGTSPNWGLFEGEFITAGTPADVCIPIGEATQFGWTAGPDVTTDFAGDRNWIVSGNSATLSGFANLVGGIPGGGSYSIYTESVSGGCRYAEIAFPAETSSAANDVGHLLVTAGADSWGITYPGFAIENGVVGSNLGGGWATPGTVMMFAYKDGNLWIGRNGAWLGSFSDPETGANPIHTGILAAMSIAIYYFPTIPSVTVEVRTEDSQFTYPIPEGFSAWGTPEFQASEVWVPDTEDLEDVCDSEMARCRRVSGWYDNSELAGIEVTGAVFNSSAKDSLEQLAAAYYFGATCRDQLITRLRGSSSIATISYASSGAGVDNAGEPFTGVEVPDDLEVPAYFNVTSPDVDADYDAGTEVSDRMITNSTEVRQVQLITVLTAAERKGRANALSMDAWVGSHSASLAVDDTQAKLEPCDVVTATDEDGNTYRVRIVRENYASGVKSLDVVLDDASALPTEGITAAPFEPTISVAAPGETTWIMLCIHILEDGHDGPCVYAAITGSGEWPGATLYRSTDDVSYAAVGSVTRSAKVGTVTELDDFTGWTWDESSSITVTLSNTDHTLTSSTFDAMEADETINAAAIGVDGRWEFVRFRTATFVEAGVYTLSGFLRGQKGTEYANSQHEAGDAFVLLANDGILRIAHDASSIGATRYYKAVTNGALVSSVTGEAFIDTGEALMPYAVVDLTDVADEAGWNRRSRLSAPPIYAEPPIGETTESYDVELLDGADAVLESATVSTNTWAHSPGGAKVRVYQKSETVGRGHVAELEL